MLGLFWHIFRSKAFLGCIFRVLLHLLPLLVVFFATWDAPASILEPQVGHMLAHISLLTAFFDMLQGLLRKNLAGIHFLLFVSTMQRGGTCAAHGIDEKAMLKTKAKK